MSKPDRTNYHGLSKSSLIATITQLEKQHDADGIRLRDEARYIKKLEAERDELKQELEQIKVCAERDVELKALTTLFEKLEREASGE